MNRVLPALGWLLFLGCGAVCLANYGAHWHLGRYGMPAPLIVPGTGLHPNGAPVHPVELALAGIYEEVMLALASIFFLTLGATAFEIRKKAKANARDSERNGNGPPGW